MNKKFDYQLAYVAISNHQVDCIDGKIIYMRDIYPEQFELLKSLIEEVQDGEEEDKS